MRDILKGTAEVGSAAATLKPHPPALDSALATLSAAAPLYYWLAQDSQRANLEAAAAALKAVPDALREHAAKLDGAVQTLLKAKPAEQAIFPKLMLLTSGPRLENAHLFGQSGSRS